MPNLVINIKLFCSEKRCKHSKNQSYRFWYENAGVFPPEQLIQLKQVMLARVICDSSDNINRVQKDVFVLPGSQDEYVTCDEIPSLNLKTWTDCCEGTQSHIFELYIYYCYCKFIDKIWFVTILLSVDKVDSLLVWFNYLSQFVIFPGVLLGNWLNTCRPNTSFSHSMYIIFSINCLNRWHGQSMYITARSFKNVIHKLAWNDLSDGIDWSCWMKHVHIQLTSEFTAYQNYPFSLVEILIC